MREHSYNSKAKFAMNDQSFIQNLREYVSYAYKLVKSVSSVIKNVSSPVNLQPKRWQKENIPLDCPLLPAMDDTAPSYACMQTLTSSPRIRIDILVERLND